MEYMNSTELNDTVLCTVVSETTVMCGEEEYHSESLYKADDWRFWVFLILYAFLVLFAGKWTVQLVME